MKNLICSFSNIFELSYKFRYNSKKKFTFYKPVEKFNLAYYY